MEKKLYIIGKDIYKLNKENQTLTRFSGRHSLEVGIDKDENVLCPLCGNPINKDGVCIACELKGKQSVMFFNGFFSLFSPVIAKFNGFMPYFTELYTPYESEQNYPTVKITVGHAFDAATFVKQSESAKMDRLINRSTDVMALARQALKSALMQAGMSEAEAEAEAVKRTSIAA